MREAGFNVAGESPIVPVIVGEAAAAVAASERLLEAGFHVQAIRPPSVSEGTSRLRATVTAAHTPDQLKAAAAAITAVLAS